MSLHKKKKSTLRYFFISSFKGKGNGLKYFSGVNAPPVMFLNPNPIGLFWGLESIGGGGGGGGAGILTPPPSDLGN